MASESKVSDYSVEKVQDHVLRSIEKSVDNYWNNVRVDYAHHVLHWTPALVEIARRYLQGKAEAEALAALLATAQESEEAQRKRADLLDRSFSYTKTLLASAQARADLAEKARDHHYERVLLLERAEQAREIANDSALKARIFDLEQQVRDLDGKLALRIEADLKRRDDLEAIFKGVTGDLGAIVAEMKESV